MKHFFICAIIAFSVSSAAGAQQAAAQSVQSQPEIESDSTLMISSQFRFKDWWSPALDIGITKWASPKHNEMLSHKRADAAVQ